MTKLVDLIKQANSALIIETVQRDDEITEMKTDRGRYTYFDINRKVQKRNDRVMNHIFTILSTFEITN